MYANASSPVPISPPYSPNERSWWPSNTKTGFDAIGEWFSGTFLGFRDDPVPAHWSSTKGYVRKALFIDENDSLWSITASYDIENGLRRSHAKSDQSYVVITFTGRIEHKGRSRPSFTVTVYADDEG